MTSGEILEDPSFPEDPAMRAFVIVTKELWDLADSDRARVLRSVAILLGLEFLEDARKKHPLR